MQQRRRNGHFCRIRVWLLTENDSSWNLNNLKFGLLLSLRSRKSITNHKWGLTKHSSVFQDWWILHLVFTWIKSLDWEPWSSFSLWKELFSYSVWMDGGMKKKHCLDCGIQIIVTDRIHFHLAFLLVLLSSLLTPPIVTLYLIPYTTNSDKVASQIWL